LKAITMEPEVAQDTNSPKYIAEKLSVNIDNKEESGKLTSISSPSNEQWKEVGEKVSGFLADLPDFVTEFFGEYRRPIITVSLAIASIIAVKLLLAILGAVNDIPLMSPLFELVGMSYSAWFVYRYVLKEDTRKELGEGFGALKEQVLGKKG
jgi:CAAD domains of cyanobacterial aminoacyl-tRNA synthetase